MWDATNVEIEDIIGTLYFELIFAPTLEHGTLPHTHTSHECGTVRRFLRPDPRQPSGPTKLSYLRSFRNTFRHGRKVMRWAMKVNVGKCYIMKREINFYIGDCRKSTIFNLCFMFMFTNSGWPADFWKM